MYFGTASHPQGNSQQEQQQQQWKKMGIINKESNYACQQTCGRLPPLPWLPGDNIHSLMRNFLTEMRKFLRLCLYLQNSLRQAWRKDSNLWHILQREWGPEIPDDSRGSMETRTPAPGPPCVVKHLSNVAPFRCTTLIPNVSLWVCRRVNLPFRHHY